MRVVRRAAPELTSSRAAVAGQGVVPLPGRAQRRLHLHHAGEPCCDLHVALTTTAAHIGAAASRTAALQELRHPPTCP